MTSIYGGRQDTIENTQHGKVEKSASEILANIKQYSNRTLLQGRFRKLISTLIKEATHFSKDLTVEYHVVVFNEQVNTRFTILESKQLVQSKKDEDSKDNSYGAVGLLYNNQTGSNFLMIQFGYAGIDPVVYINEDEGFQNTVSIRALCDSEYEDFLQPEDRKKFYWAVSGKPVHTESDSSANQYEKGVEERKYAIATMFFSGNFPGLENDLKKPLGAISLDFITKSKKYPHFAFRDNEVSEVYHILQNIKEVIELIILDNTSNSLIDIIKLALGADA